MELDGFAAVLVGVDLVGVGGVVDPVVMEPAQRHSHIEGGVPAGGPGVFVVQVAPGIRPVTAGGGAFGVPGR